MAAEIIAVPQFVALVFPLFSLCRRPRGNVSVHVGETIGRPFLSLCFSLLVPLCSFPEIIFSGAYLFAVVILARPEIRIIEEAS